MKNTRDGWKPHAARLDFNPQLTFAMIPSHMNPAVQFVAARKRLASTRWGPSPLLALLILLPAHAHASMFKGEALDTVADVMSWVVLVVASIIGITVFWLVHILPEKIAEKK